MYQGVTVYPDCMNSEGFAPRTFEATSYDPVECTSAYDCGEEFCADFWQGGDYIG